MIRWHVTCTQLSFSRMQCLASKTPTNEFIFRKSHFLFLLMAIMGWRHIYYFFSWAALENAMFEGYVGSAQSVRAHSFVGATSPLKKRVFFSLLTLWSYVTIVHIKHLCVLARLRAVWTIDGFYVWQLSGNNGLCSSWKSGRRSCCSSHTSAKEFMGFSLWFFYIFDFCLLI